jgi:hypothetical protein
MGRTALSPRLSGIESAIALPRATGPENLDVLEGFLEFYTDAACVGIDFYFGSLEEKTLQRA